MDIPTDTASPYPYDSPIEPLHEDETDSNENIIFVNIKKVLLFVLAAAGILILLFIVKSLLQNYSFARKHNFSGRRGFFRERNYLKERRLIKKQPSFKERRFFKGKSSFLQESSLPRPNFFPEESSLSGPDFSGRRRRNIFRRWRGRR